MKSAKVQVFKDAQGLWRFRVVASNGKIVGVSEAYASAAKAKRGYYALERAVGEFLEPIVIASR